MFIRLCGAVLTVIGTTFYGYFLVRQLKQRIILLTGFKESLMLMSGHISYAKLSMPQLLNNIAESASIEDIRRLYHSVSEVINTNSGDTFFNIWNMGVEKCFCGQSLREVERRLFDEVGNLPLYMDGSMQVKFIEETIIRLDETIAGLKGELAQKSRVYKCLGLAVGIMIVLVLI